MDTVLQTHVAVPETAVLQSVANLDKLVAVIECHQPEADLYRYHLFWTRCKIFVNEVFIIRNYMDFGGIKIASDICLCFKF